MVVFVTQVRFVCLTRQLHRNFCSEAYRNFCYEVYYKVVLDWVRLTPVLLYNYNNTGVSLTQPRTTLVYYRNFCEVDE